MDAAGGAVAGEASGDSGAAEVGSADSVAGEDLEAEAVVPAGDEGRDD